MLGGTPYRCLKEREAIAASRQPTAVPASLTVRFVVARSAAMRSARSWRRKAAGEIPSWLLKSRARCAGDTATSLASTSILQGCARSERKSAIAVATSRLGSVRVTSMLPVCMPLNRPTASNMSKAIESRAKSPTSAFACDRFTSEGVRSRIAAGGSCRECIRVSPSRTLCR